MFLWLGGKESLRGWLNELINHNGVCRTAPATQVLLKSNKVALEAKFTFLLVYKVKLDHSPLIVQGLNEEYEKIGMEVFNAFRQDMFKQLELKVEERNEIRRNRSEWNSGWG